jgi:hypothetical protein
MLPSATALLIIFIAGVGLVLLKYNIIHIPTFSLTLTNIIRLKQVGTAFQILAIFARLSALLAPWFLSIANISLTISAPVEIEPVCASWFSDLASQEYYFVRSYFALAALSLLSSLLRYAHKVPALKARLSLDTFTKCQKWAALVVLNTPVIVLPLALRPAQMLSSYFEKVHNFSLAAAFSGFFLSLASAFILVFWLHRTVQVTSSQFKVLRREVLEELLAATAGADVTATTWEDIEKGRPYVAAFCLQYTPAEFQHEEKVVWRKIVSVMGIIVLEFIANGLAAGSCTSEIFFFSQAAFNAVFVAANLVYVPHLLRRPYVSLRKSGRMGDPLNDAELLTIRTMSWAAAILALREVVFRNQEWGQWTMDVFGVGVLAALIYSQLPLFYGLSGDAKEATRRTARRADRKVRRLLNLEEGVSLPTPRRNRRHSAAGDSGIGVPIEAMLNSESFREILLQQSKLNLAAMDPKERARWQPPAPEPRSGAVHATLVALQSKLGRRKGIAAFALLFLPLVAFPAMSMSDMYLSSAFGCILVAQVAGSAKRSLPSTMKLARVALSGFVAVLDSSAAFLFAHAWLKYSILHEPLKQLLIWTPVLLCARMEILVARAKMHGDGGGQGGQRSGGASAGLQMIGIDRNSSNVANPVV